MFSIANHFPRQPTQHCHLVSGLRRRHPELIGNALDQPPQREGQAVGPGEVRHLGAFQGVIEGCEEGVCEHGDRVARDRLHRKWELFSKLTRNGGNRSVFESTSLLLIRILART